MNSVLAGDGTGASPRRADTARWAGRAMSGLAILFLTMDGAMKLVRPQVVIDTTRQLGWPADDASLLALAALLLIPTLLYAIPRTAFLGAVLITAYLGGAVATHVRIGSPLLSHELFGVYIGAIVWGGLWLRDSRVRALLPMAR